MADPLVSVIMPCFNGEAFITEAIDSVLNQTFKDFELIVVNDGSTDRSAQLLQAYTDSIRIIHQENRGVSAARNAGIQNAVGQYIAFLDSDDYWDRDFLTRLIAGMADARTAIAYCGWQNVGTVQSRAFIPPDYETADKLHHLLRFASLWPIHAILIRREFLPSPAPFNPEYPSCEDYDLWLRIAAFNRIQLVPHVLAFYRRHGDDQATSDQARVAHYNLLVKQRFLEDFPSLRRTLTSARLREYYAGAFLQRGYRCLWGGDLVAAYKIFRQALMRGMVRFRDLKYAVPTLLPFRLYAHLATRRDRTRAL